MAMHTAAFARYAFWLVTGLVALAPAAMAIEEAPYKPIETHGSFELREYAPYVVAETFVEGDFEAVGNEGFRRLVKYIGGENQGAKSIAMTAPVEQARAPQKIAMTAPVEQARAGDRWRIAFVLPASYTIETAPVPNDDRIRLAQTPPRTVAAVRYSGRWTEENYARHLGELEAWIKARGLVATGEPVWARYNPPMMPWFLRRNEILIPVQRD
jgi:hypothetical protein